CEHAASGISPGTKNFFASQNGKSPLPGGQARRNKLSAPLAGSLLAPLRCAAPCQCRSRATWLPSRYPYLSKLLSHLPFGRAVYLRPGELHALRNSALQTCFDPSISPRSTWPNAGPAKSSKSTHCTLSVPAAKAHPCASLDVQEITKTTPTWRSMA